MVVDVGTALSPAVPEYLPDADRAHAEVGRLTLYNAQLREELQRRAVEANDLHNRLTTALARIAELEGTAT